MGEAHNAAAVATGFAKRLSQNPTDIFHSVMTVDFEIAFGTDFQIKMPVPRQLGEHVIEKRNTGPDLIFARTIKIEAYPDFRLVGLPRLGCLTWIHFCSPKPGRAPRGIDRFLPEFLSRLSSIGQAGDKNSHREPVRPGCTAHQTIGAPAGRSSSR